MSDVLEVIVVLARELVTERGRHEDARQKFFVFVYGEAVACSDSVGVESLEEVGVGVLCVFPFENSEGRLEWIMLEKISSSGAGRSKTWALMR